MGKLDIASLAVFSLAIGVLIGKSLEYYKTKELQEKRTSEYVKILADQRKAHVALDLLKYTIASKCNDVYEKREYVPFEGAFRTGGYNRLCWASCGAQ